MYIIIHVWTSLVKLVHFYINYNKTKEIFLMPKTVEEYRKAIMDMVNTMSDDDAAELYNAITEIGIDNLTEESMEKYLKNKNL